MLCPPRLVLVVAVARNGVIGRGNALPWRLKSDMRHFRGVTLGKPVIMGRKTFQSLRKPLEGRTNIVISRDAGFIASGCVLASSLEKGLEVARGDALRRGVCEIMLIGGAHLYELALALAERMIVTHVDLAPEGDCFFALPDSQSWEAVSRVAYPAGEGDEAAYDIVVYERLREFS